MSRYEDDHDLEEEAADVTIVFEDGVVLDPVDKFADLPDDPLPGNTQITFRAYVRDENAFYVWADQKWSKRDI